MHRSKGWFLMINFEREDREFLVTDFWKAKFKKEMEENLKDKSD